jgi:DNA-binding NarL/FixJ family response regulator
MIRILVADDHVIFRQGLIRLLQSTGNISVVGETGDGREVIPLIEKEQPAIVVLDISLPGNSGFEIAEEMQKRGLESRVIFLTMHNDPLTAQKALQLNVFGYVVKDNAFEDLLYAIRSVSAGGKFISPSISDKIFDSSPARKSDQILTRREREILSLIASGLTNKQMADKLFISIKTVETHRTRILQKLDIHTTADLVRYAIKSGLVDLD